MTITVQYLTIKSVDGVLGTRTQGGEDEIHFPSIALTSSFLKTLTKQNQANIDNIIINWYNGWHA